MEAADDFNRDRVAEAASVAVFVEMDRVVDIAVAGDDAMPSQYVEKRFTFGRIVRKRLIDCGDQSETLSDSRSQPMIKWPWQMKGPVAIADHVMNPHGDRALGHRLKNLQRRRIMFENSTRDPGNQIEKLGSIRIVPRPFGMIEPENRLHEINRVAEQHQIDELGGSSIATDPLPLQCKHFENLS